MSTSLPGQFLRENVNQNRNDFIEAKLGVVETGAWADILIWDGDPTHESFRAAPAPSGHSFNL
jgi:hypothetical protein